ncbi:hypothetical protein B0A58_13870 [Flavobacterium branchiophilum NBRC 15030 = ATCC 35035]|uniref:Uncharacterized protein n=1 Tax=Flavobacterium branchiophilum TaxID=55197 RepID=A0A543G0Y6_9FLAO|nr:hypothetical protein B0A58_13870 [Flavobacterium branchiophilum NBRC 15030 = ATCC 35035]TQM39748.1 hypothetical protein BC670_0577 [Flavobacterium branchiophilum]
MKPSKLYNITLLFISHIYIYSFTFILLYNLIRFIKTDFFILKDFLIMSISSPLFVMYIGDTPFIILLMPIMFFIIKYFKPENNIFKIYVISVILISIVNYILLYLNKRHYLDISVISYEGELEYNKLHFMIVSAP